MLSRCITSDLTTFKCVQNALRHVYFLISEHKAAHWHLVAHINVKSMYGTFAQCFILFDTIVQSIQQHFMLTMCSYCLTMCSHWN